MSTRFGRRANPSSDAVDSSLQKLKSDDIHQNEDLSWLTEINAQNLSKPVNEKEFNTSPRVSNNKVEDCKLLTKSFGVENTNTKSESKIGFQKMCFPVTSLASVNLFNKQSETHRAHPLSVEYTSLLNELASIDKEVNSVLDRVSSQRTESADIMLLSETVEAYAFERRQRAEEIKVLIARAHRERIKNICQRANERVSQYATEDKVVQTTISKQLIELKADIAKEKQELEALKESGKNIEPQESLIEANAVSELRRLLPQLIQNIKEDLQCNLKNVLSENLHIGLKDAVADKIQLSNCERLNRLMKFRDYQKERENTSEKILITNRESRKLEENQFISEIHSEWDKFLFDRRIKNDESAREFDDIIKLDIERYRNNALRTLQDLNKKCKHRMDDFRVAAAKRISEIRQKNATELLHYQALHTSERNSITTSKCGKDCDMAGLCSPYLSIDTVGHHCRRILDEVSFSLNEQNLQVYGEDTKSIIKNHEQKIVDLREHIRRQRESLFRDWHYVQQLLANLAKDADQLSETMSNGRVSLISIRDSATISTEAWEKDLTQVFNQCFAGSKDAKLHHREDVVADVLYNINCRIRALTEKSENLCKLQKVSQQEMDRIEEESIRHNDCVVSLVNDIISHLEIISTSADRSSGTTRER